MKQDKPLLITAVFLFIILVAGIAYYVADVREQNTSQAESTETTSSASDATMDQSGTGDASSEKSVDSNTSSSADFYNLVAEKDRIDTQIGETANAINSYLNTHDSFRSADELKSRAQNLESQASAAKARAAHVNADSAARDALVHLFQLEIERVHGLYKGMIDNSNGGDYSNGFQDGTRASYAFDSANNAFNQKFKK